MPDYSQKKIWSPNSPFFGQAVFAMQRAASWCNGGRARMLTLPDAMAALTENITPKRWSNTWLRKKFIAEGMPEWNGEMVLMFSPKFVVAMHEQSRNEANRRTDEIEMDTMIDRMREPSEPNSPARGRIGLGCWASRGRQTMPGGPMQKTRQMVIRFKK